MTDNDTVSVVGRWSNPDAVQEPDTGELEQHQIVSNTAATRKCLFLGGLVSEFNGYRLHHIVKTKCKRLPRDVFLCQKYFHLFSVIDQYFAFYRDTVDDKASAKLA